MWNHTTSSLSYRAEAVCSYTIAAIKLIHHADNKLLKYTFTITQTNCTQQPPIFGTTTFEIFAHSRLFVTGCVVHETMTELYRVTCSYSYAHTDSTNATALLASNDVLCLSLTAILLFEHGDVFTETLGAQVENAFPITSTYLSPRVMLADKVRYCFPSMHTDNSSTLILDVPDGLEIYSAVWQATSLFPAAMTAPITNITIDPSVVFASLPELPFHRFGVVGNNYFGNGTFHTAWEHSGKRVPPTGIEYDYVLVRLKGKKAEAISTQDLASAYYLTNRSSDHSRGVVTILGASHGRFFFDALDEYAYGAAIMDGENRKHGSMTAHSVSYLMIALVDDVADEISKICSRIDSGSAHLRHKIVFHSGPHDLSTSGPRKFLRDVNSMPKLMKVITEIVQNGCGSAISVDIVWFLTAPYPLCDPNPNSECERMRFWRYNPSIAAANSRVLAFVHDLMRQPKSAHSKTTLKVIDWYSMIKPRLGFDESSEVACLSHFICRIKWGRGIYRPGNTIFSPAGKAAFDALMHALL